VRTIGLCLIVLAGCVDELQGSNIEFDFKSNTPTQAVVDTAAASPGQFPRDIHFSLYALSSSDTTGYMFKIQDFEIHKIVDLTSPCFIDVGEHVPHPGLHVSQYLDVIKQDTGISDPLNPPADASQDNKIEAATAYQRDRNVHLLYDDSTGIKALSDASTAVYPAVASACGATDGIPRPECTDEASNKRRLEMCQAFWNENPSYFEGTDRILTDALNGTMHGMVDGTNPVAAGSLVGGAQFFVDEALAGFDTFAIYTQYDDADGDGIPDYPPGTPDSQKSEAGQLYLYGKVSAPTRDVLHVHLKSPDVTSSAGAEMIIFPNLGEDNVHF
jgi:hypothetical protein